MSIPRSLVISLFTFVYKVISVNLLLELHSGQDQNMFKSIFDHYRAKSTGFYLKGIIRSITDGSYPLDTGCRIKVSKTLIRYLGRLLTTFSAFTIQYPIVPVSIGNSDLSWRANWLDIHSCIKFSHPTT